MTALDLTLVYLLAAVLGVVLMRTLKLPPMLGYLVVGVIIGPNALALAKDANTEGLQHLAEFGVVFLMFVIGLEFSLPRLKAMKQHVFGLGMSQVFITIVVTALGAVIMKWLLPTWWPITWQMALALGGVMAMSSTAIVVKMMAERLEIDSEHGKRIFGILLFQDLAVVPLLVFIPALAAGPETMLTAMLMAVIKATLLLILLLTYGQKWVRWWLTLVARRKSEELFILNLLLLTLGMAWLTELAGLSLALGAFVAGMLISETEYKHQVETDIRPFHDVLLGLFFITIGMLLDWRLLLDRWPLVLLLLVLSIGFKVVIITSITRLWGASLGVALRTGMYLGTAGEFGLVLLTLASKNHLVPPALFNPILASMVVSMMITPFVILYANDWVTRIVGSEWLMQSVQMTHIARKAMNTKKHVIICGYGRCGQNLARLLEGENIPYMALDLDPDRVRQAAAAGHSVVFGDAARLQALMAAGLHRASALVITYIDLQGAMKVLHLAHEHAPQVPVVVRTKDDADWVKLQQAGATEMVPEAVEGSLMLASHALALVGVPMRRVIRLVQEQREARYQLLRGYFHGLDDMVKDDAEYERLCTVILPVASRFCRQTLGDIAFHAMGVTVVSMRRLGKNYVFDDTTRLEGGDILVLRGEGPALALAEAKLLGG